MDQQLTTLAAIIGFVIPAAIATINRESWSSSLKAAVAFALCVGAAIVTCAVAGKLNTTDLPGTAIIVFGAAIVTYERWWKPSGIADKIEHATG